MMNIKSFSHGTKKEKNIFMYVHTLHTQKGRKNNHHICREFI